MTEIAMAENERRHEVVKDWVGVLMPNQERLTCRSEGCNEATLVYQPYMSQTYWENEKNNFLAKHPCSDIKYK